MRIISKRDVTEPVRNPFGEVIYEMIGATEDLGGAKHHSLAVITIPPGKSSGQHYHHVSEETYFVTRGVARVLIDGQEFRLEAGQACLIQPPEKHQIFNIGRDDLEFVAVCAPPWVLSDSTFV